MPDLSVDLDGLEAVLLALSGVMAGLDGTRAVVDAASDVVGSPDVAVALDEFERHWDDGRTQIRENLESVQQGLRTAVREYRQADQDLADSLDRHETVHHTVTDAR